MNNKYLFLFPFLMLTTICFSQVNRNTLIYFDWGQFKESKDTVEIIADSLRSKLSKVDSLLINEYSKKPLAKEKLFKFALDKGYDSAIYILIKGTMKDVQVDWVIFDSVFDKAVVEDSFHDVIDPDFTNIIGGFWQPLVLSLRESLFSFSSKLTLTIQALPESRIYGLGKNYLLTNKNGIATARINSYSTYSISIIKKGYYAQYMDVLANEANSNLIIEQKKRINLEFDLGLYDLSYLRLGMKYYFIPDTAYISLSTTIFQAQFIINSPTADDYNPEIGLPNLNMLTIGIGGAVDLSHIKLRIPMGIELFLRMSGDASNKLDPVATWGMEFPIGLEYSVHENVTLYFEYSPLFYIINDELLFKQYLEGGWKSNIIQTTKNAGIDLMHVNLGIRVRL